MKTLTVKLSDALAPVLVPELWHHGFETITVEEGRITGIRDRVEGSDLICRIEQREDLGEVYMLAQFGRVTAYKKVEISVRR